MSDELHISSAVLTIVGACLGVLLAVIAYFLDRLVKQFDALSKQFGVLNTTMTKIDKDLSGEVKVLNTTLATLRHDVDEFEPVWDRLRQNENDITAIKSGCLYQQGKCHP